MSALRTSRTGRPVDPPRLRLCRGPASARWSDHESQMFALAVIAQPGIPEHAVRMALRCLLVDDDARFLESARALLELEGIEVDTASTGAQAVRRPVSCGLTSCCWICASAARADSTWRENFRQPGRQRAHPTMARGLSSSRHTLNRTSDVSSRRVPCLDLSPNLPSRPGPSENCLGARAELAGIEPSENCQDTAVIVRARGKP